ncbi:protein bicaudal C isoform X2 [Chironomus tepperi]|uniref:protein bicaudal C isoform X2 n=1 Tax=Chironomus tepperi TaxID=113505 RepID=UPI00391F7A84
MTTPQQSVPFNILSSRFSSIAGTSTGPPSEAPSSELSSVDSFSDLRTIAAGLGITDPEEIYTERFKIDRIKLEEMIKLEGYCETMNKAEWFFANLMKESLVHVSWPCRLKIGAKTRKDPHVRIIGKKEDVLRVKDKVMAVLDAKGNRVIMKMDVSYTDHSYIIGRGGNNIKRIMDETQTHIHFPDSNRSNPTEKSNQVSLCGSLEGVEKARSLVRESTPLLLSFELPIMYPGAPSYDNNTPFIKEMEKQYGVQVIFSARPKLHSSMVLVKGCEKEHKNVIDATRRIIEFMFEDQAPHRHVIMHLEITTSHHPIVLGRNAQNLREIMQRTNTIIIFQDSNDSNVKPIKRSQVTISGPISGVYLARQQLLGNIPVTVIFDYPDINIDSETIKELMATHDVFISSRPKARQSTMCIVIKGIEKFITNIYDARHELLKLTSDRIIADIPHSYYGPNDMTNFKDSSVAQLVASSMTYSAMSPIQIPQLPWSNNINPELNWRSRVTQQPASPLTATLLQQHNQITSSMQIPSINIANNGSVNGSSRNTSPENSINYGSKYPTMGNYMESPMNQQNINDSVTYSLDPRIIAGLRAMSLTPQQGEVRTPTSAWQGMGISRTSPSQLEHNSWSDAQPPDGIVPGLFNMTTSLLDSTPMRHRSQLSNYSDIATLLTGLGLGHHIQHFVNAEIDMSVFPTLNEQDLINLGIKALGARRRIMMAIQNMNQLANMHQDHIQQQQNNSQQSSSNQHSSPPTPLRGFRFNGSAAPGDERRSSGN